MQTINKIGIIIGRFQTPELHKGHIYLLNFAKANHTQNLILLGESPVKASTRNPLSVNDRVGMIRELNIMNPATTYYWPLRDTKEDEAWSKQIDEIIAKQFGASAEAVLYGGRDSSLSYYSGKHQTTEIPELPEYKDYSATAVREALKTDFTNNKDYRSGRILAYNDMFPIMYSTVDVAIFSGETREFLFGRKPNETQYRFIGGFVDTTDTCREDAVIRECKEETNLDVTPVEHICSLQVDDWRYRRERDKIMTDLYVCQVDNFDKAVASDDLSVEKGGEIKSFNLFKMTDEMIIDTHIPLLRKLKLWYSKQPYSI